ncbi:MAG: glutamate-1-semialdehyde 2,1-aminomutase [bacterium]|jgi:glutamate-1-semialdehyde 2,1-aminomutase|nr:glutamate-1-semialdehyde 2,1-aminomutase [Betaproteobacteria bacterium]
MRPNSEALFERSQKLIPGGVNSPVRAFRSVGGTPVFFERALGAHAWDVDGNRYIDYIGSWGPAILGHADPVVLAAVERAARNGLSFGAPTAGELKLAEALVAAVPSIESVRLVSSGTEATMSAIRVARGFTGRSRIVKFEGCYHGHGDSLLVKAGSGALTLGQPSSAGVPPELAQHTLVLQYNDIDEVARTFREIGDTIAAVIVEPIAGNMNMVLPQPGFLQTLREVCTRHGVVLIFDEVMTGFRVAPGSAQGLYGITPDLSTFGKVIGGGMPLGAFGGRRDVMAFVAPTGPVYQAGTLSGNPVAVAAGLATLEQVLKPGFHDRLGATTRAVCDAFVSAGQANGIALSAQSVGGMFGLYFSETPPQDFAQVMACDSVRFNAFFHRMLDHGVYLAPSAYEAGFVSIAHGAEEVAATATAARAALAAMAAG